MSRDNSVSIETRLGVGQPGARLPSGQIWDFSLHHHHHAYPASYRMFNGTLNPGSSKAGAWWWPLTSI